MLPFLLALLLPAQAAQAPQDQEIATAASIGTIIYALDRAAWVASDAMTARTPQDRLTGGGGWVVERGDDNRLVVTFYRGDGAGARAFFVAEVFREKVQASRVLPAGTALTQAQQLLARARSAAAAEAATRGFRPCTDKPFNTVVVPSDNPQALILVYLLTAQTATGAYPIGGHYRVVIGPNGQATDSRALSRACLNMTTARGPGGQKPAGLFVNHVLDPIPTEAHVFTSLAARMPLFVGAGGKVWAVDGRAITVSDMKPPAPPR